MKKEHNMDEPDEDLGAAGSSPIAELLRTRPEAFDFADAPDLKPLSEEYLAAMAALRPAWAREGQDC
ncbi:hypothetical protein [Brevundimonas sp. DC300-4]|uniref:hypothetical protein n=1 Tax=Brevundimonas sp. DC300-4 TaxID=2804594 RepID=UPI003CF52EAC